MSSESDFLSLLGDDAEDVVRLKKTERVAVQKKGEMLVDKLPRRAAAMEQSQPLDTLSSDPIDMLDPMDELSYMRPGVQHGVFKNLRLGKYSTDARLDLHGLKVEQARSAVYQFIKDCLANDVRAALITHGKGVGREKPALLKSCVAHWLPQLENVMAFHTAQKQHGGYGATYVLIKKSQKEKLKTKRQNTKHE